MSSQLEQERASSKRFSRAVGRRDVLGLAAKWSAIVTWVTALLGVVRLPMPGVFPEKGSRFKIGRPEKFVVDSVTFIPERCVYVFATRRGFYAISAVCSHLGCIVQRSAKSGEFLCPCHGSKFLADGGLLKGPAPAGLSWLEVSLSPNGELRVDERKPVPQGAIFVL